MSVGGLDKNREIEDSHCQRDQRVTEAGERDPGQHVTMTHLGHQGLSLPFQAHTASLQRTGTLTLSFSVHRN